MSTASLSLLKKGKKTALDEELAKPEPAPVVEAAPASTDAATVTVEIENMSEAELDQFVADQGIETPAEWVGFDHGQKLSWMEATFGDKEQTQPAENKDTVKVYADGEIVTEANTVEQIANKNGGLLVDADASDPGDGGTKAKGKGKKPKGTAVATSDVKNGEIVEPDVLQNLVHEIENLKETEAMALVGKLTEQTEMTFFKLGGVLSLVLANQWYSPYANFREWVEKVHGLHYRKATYWIEIYNRLSNSGVPWHKVSKIGWTKLKEIAKVLTPENVDEWVQVASEQTTINLIETVKNHLLKEANKQITDETEAKIVSTMTFKLYDDQKATVEAALAKAKEATGAAVPTKALEYMAMDYLNSLSLSARLQAIGIEKAIKEFETAFPNANLSLELTDGSGSE